MTIELFVFGMLAFALFPRGRKILSLFGLLINFFLRLISGASPGPVIGG